jgi:NRAMP (natural resistance-associated macrophage protein)-like metal ion transporter
MSARMGMVTGKGLADLIRENSGIRTAFWVMVSLFITNLGNTMAEFSGWAASMELFGVSKYISIPVGAFFVWFLVTKWDYSVFEKIFLGICFIYITYIISAFLAKPDWGEVMQKTVAPNIEWSKSYLIMIVSIIGTSITPWQQFYLQAGVVEKGLNEKDARASKVDVIFGSIMMGVVAYSDRHSRRCGALPEAVGREVCIYPFCYRPCQRLFILWVHTAPFYHILYLRGHGLGNRDR